MKQNRKYLTVHKKNKRGGKDKTLNSEELITKAKELSDTVSKEKLVKDLVRRYVDISCRIDLVGSPETSFVIKVVDGKLKFSTAKQFTDMAVGIHKDFFSKLIKNPSQLGNIKQIYNNIIFRKGTVKLLKYGTPILSALLLTGNDKK
ncbi:MAG: hypothetical protein ABIH28_03690 [archaeon]